MTSYCELILPLRSPYAPMECVMLTKPHAECKAVKEDSHAQSEVPVRKNIRAGLTAGDSGAGHGGLGRQLLLPRIPLHAAYLAI